MSNRITDANLQAVVDRLNRTTKSPMSYRDDSGAIAIGHFHLSYAYGGVSLCRMVNTGGGCSDVFLRGHMPKRDLYELMHAFLRGIDFVRGE